MLHGTQPCDSVVSFKHSRFLLKGGTFFLDVANATGSGRSEESEEETEEEEEEGGEAEWVICTLCQWRE